MSAPRQPRVFISAASGEFRPLREQLAALLQRSGINVEYQEVFPQTAADTVRKLGDLIKDCPLLVHMVGHHPGSTADANAVADLLHGLPLAQFLPRFPDLRQQLGDCSGITYTQWEALLALHYSVPVFVYAPADACEAGTQTLKDTFAQKTHLQRLLLARRHPDYCRDDAEFIGKILADVHRHFGIVPPALTPHNLPYPSLGTLFKGRTDFLAHLRARLAQEQAIVINGMGGVGKTRAAVEYAWGQAADCRALLFVTADSPDTLDRHLAALSGGLILNLPEQDAHELAVQVSAVRRWLNQHPGWLLILDNVDTPEAQSAVAPLVSALPEGHIVITSRLADWPAGLNVLDLDVLSEESSIAFLLERTEGRRLRRDADRETAAQIARTLDRLALALEQCAAYIRHRRVALADYLADWEGKRPAVLAWHDATKSYYPKSVTITYDTSVWQLSEDARALLRLLSWIAPDPVPVWAVEKLTSFPDPRAQLVELTDFHLARLSPDGTTCSVHRLLQEITRQQQPEAQPPALTAALEWVNAEYPEGADDVRVWPVAIPLAPHAIAVATYAADHDIAAPSGRLLDAAASLQFARANYRVAEPLMRRALAMAETTDGDAHPTVANRLNNLAHLLLATNRLAEAEPLMRRALAITEASYGDAHPDVAARLNNLAQLLQATNRLADAEALMRRVLAMDEARYGDAHPAVARGLNNLAHLLQATNRLAEAEPLMRRARAITEASYGDAHPDVASDLGNLAALLQDTNRLAEAEPLMRRALAIDEASYGDAHPTVAIALNNLGHLLQATNRLAEAERLMRRALAIFEASYGDAHPDVATALCNLASLLQNTNRLVEAEPLMRREVAILRTFSRDTGHKHPHLEDATNRYVRLLVAMGDTSAQANDKVATIASENV